MSTVKNPNLEMLALVILSALMGSLGVMLSLIAADLIQGRHPNLASLGTSDTLKMCGLVGFGFALTALIWYVRHGWESPFRYWDGVVWGLVCYAMSATLALVVSLQSVAKDVVLGLPGTLVTVYVVGGVFALPAIFTVAPLTLLIWYKAVSLLG
jgi:hypothetical protein